MTSYSIRRRRGYPEAVQREFVAWLVLSQARSALIEILDITGMREDAVAIQSATSYLMVAALSKRAGRRARANRLVSDQLGMSTAEAAAHLMFRLAQVAQDDACDPHRIAFFSAQLCGWSGFAQNGFSASFGKERHHTQVLADQDARLRDILAAHQSLS